MQSRPDKFMKVSRVSGYGLAILTFSAALAIPGASLPVTPQKAPVLLATNGVAAPNPPPRSVFVDDFDQGKDPFFPHSTRRSQPGKGSAIVSAPPVLDQLVLKGITGTKNRRFAIINSEVFGVGEEHDLTLAGQRLNLRCEQINETSVVVSVKGQPNKKELKLRQF
jgi:hypothetical protein